MTLSLVGGPKFVPVVVAAGFIECAEVAEPGLGPELPATFEAGLLLPTSRFDRARANRPSAAGHPLVAHPFRMALKGVLLPPNDLANFAPGVPKPRHLAQGFLFLAPAQFMPQGFDPA